MINLHATAFYHVLGAWLGVNYALLVQRRTCVVAVLLGLRRSPPRTYPPSAYPATSLSAPGQRRGQQARLQMVRRARRDGDGLLTLLAHAVEVALALSLPPPPPPPSKNLI